jgi:hypothetical protein
MYGKITKPFWDDRPVAVVNGGPSLLDFDYEQLRGAHVLAVKGAIFNIPWADAGFGIDVSKYVAWRSRLTEVQCRVYWALTEDQFGATAPHPVKNITLLKLRDGHQVSDDPDVIYGGGTSGFGALQVCIHKRAKQIVLFGFDYDGEYSATAGDPRRRDQVVAKWATWAEHFSVYTPYFSAHGISVVNACPTSAIRCFQKVTLQDAVELCTRRAAA